ncbi:MAG: amidohydrolase, partial [Burkholderiaceae bacterium]|nr:amidohydrolase [Burkholderiaceae bacterium]
MTHAPQPVDLLIVHGTLITVDPARRVIEDGALAVAGERIVAVGSSAELIARYTARKTLNARRKAVLPGLIDCHGHAGHGLLKTLGGGDSEAWMEACRVIYTTGSDEDFWYAEAALAALERLKCGTTTGVCLFGGGDSIMRVDDPRYAARHCAAIAEAGTRSFLAVGPSRPPAPRTYATWDGGQRRDRDVSWDEMHACCEEI